MPIILRRTAGLGWILILDRGEAYGRLNGPKCIIEDGLKSKTYPKQNDGLGETNFAIDPSIGNGITV
jgi:hypothetical protein